MKVFNISDVETPILVERGLANSPIRVGDTIIPPGTSADVHRKHRATAMRFAGALARKRLIGWLPTSQDRRLLGNIAGRQSGCFSGARKQATCDVS